MWDNFVTGFNQQLTPQVWELIGVSTFQTIYMTLAATIFAIVFGMPLGILTFLTRQGEVRSNPKLNRVLELLINIGRSIPFIILLLVLMPSLVCLWERH